MTADHGSPRPEPPVVRVAPMRRRHLRSVLRIESQVYPRPWSLSLYLGELAQPEERRIYVVGRVNSEVVGHAGLMFAAGDGHITTVAVDPAWQHRGIATRVLLVLIRAAIRGGATALTLEVRAGNETAQALYRRFGFAEAGVRTGYYPETNEDALIMWANDVAGESYARLLDQIESELSGPAVIDEVVAGSRRPSVRRASGAMALGERKR